ncbi:MAG: glycosyltransferase [Phycisphaerae bacterium]
MRPSPRRRVLVLASRFPPDVGPGPTRLAKTVRYLQDFDWSPVVISDGSAAAVDDSQRASHQRHPRTVADRCAGAEVHHVPHRGPACEPNGLTPLFRALGRLSAPFGRDAGDWKHAAQWRGERWRRRLALPDRGIWRTAAVQRLAARLHRDHRFDALFSSGMPFSDHMIALALYHRWRIPWVAEFRDPWVEYAHAPQWRGPCTRWLTRAMEALVVRHARFVVCVSDAMCDRFRRRYPAEPRAKFVTVWNGFDPADFEEPTARDTEPPAVNSVDESLNGMLRGDRFSLLHAGSLYAGRRPGPLLEAVRRFIASGPRQRRATRVILAGRLGEFTDEVRHARESIPLAMPGDLPQGDVLACMRRAAVNVLILADGPGTLGDVSTKVFEYLAAGRPILAIVPPAGQAARLLRQSSDVWQAAPNDVEGIERALHQLFDRWRNGRTTARRDGAALHQWTRRYQTGRLARVLEAAASRRAAPQGGQR